MAKKKKTKKISPEERYESMISRWGTHAKWGDAELYLTADEMEEYFGPRCEEFDPYCGNCTNWLKWNSTGKAVISFERDKFVQLLREGKL